MNEITEIQRRILICVREWIAEHGEVPTIREIGQQSVCPARVRRRTSSGDLEQHGLISRSARSWRSIRLC
jgi:LexA DNA binding domain-containing protein